MVQQVTIDAQTRDRAGKGAARATRRDGRVPAVVYGARQDPILISLDPREIRKRLDAGTFFSTVYELKLGTGAERVLARDVQFHPVSDAPLHVDFLRVTAETKVTIEVPVHFLNEEESPGIRRGGVLNVVRHEVEVLCAVDAIPHAFEIDLTGLEIGDSIHISHVNLPDGVVPTIADRDFTIATVAAPTVVAEEQGGEEPAAEPVEGAEAEQEEGEKEEEPVLLLVGLGNPGPKYADNRHNIGFMAVDEIVRRHGFGAWRARFQGLAANGVLDGEKVLALKPTTFMNHSGRAVGEAMRFFKLESAAVTVVHDELDLAFGKVRVKQGGGHAGHNGLRDIDAHIGADFWRVRVGIGHPGDKELVHGHVLSDFAKADRPRVERLVAALAEAAPLLAGGQQNAFMSKIALLTAPPRPEGPASGADGETEQKDRHGRT